MMEAAIDANEILCKPDMRINICCKQVIRQLKLLNIHDNYML